MKRRADAAARHRVPRNTSLLKMSVIAVALGLVCVGILQTFGGAEEPAKASERDSPAVAASSGDASQAGAGCTTTTAARAVVPTVMADVIAAAAKAACVDLELVAADGRAGVRASEEDGVDLWVSDSTMWAQARRLPIVGEPTSIASSPVVAVAAPETAAAVSTAGVFSWQTVAGLPEGSSIAFQDPTATATGLLTAWPVLSTLRAYDSVRFHGLALSANALAGSTLLSAEAMAAPPAGTLGFAAEYAVQPGEKVAILRGKEGEAYFDFPAYNQASDPPVRAAVQTLIDTAASAEMAEKRGAAQVRNAAGEPEFEATAFGSGGPRLPMPGPRDTVSIFGLSASGSAVGRNLVAIDVSGSMAAVLPNGTTLFDTVRETSMAAMTTLLDHTSVGLWAFGSEIDGARDHRELVPIAPLGTNRKQLLGALRSMEPIPTSGTGLYDTVLAGYRTLQRGFDPTAVTTLIVMTDGQNDEAAGLSLAQLTAELKRIQDPAKPIELAGIGFGQADVASLDQITDVIGGRVARVKDPMQLLGIMISMIGQTAAKA